MRSPRRSCGRDATLPCPRSATHAGVAVSGVACMLLGVTMLNFWQVVQDIAAQALMVMSCAAVGILAPDLLWQKVYRRSLASTARPGNWRRTLTKFAGLLGAVGLVAALYWVFPEYAAAGFYAHCVAALQFVLPLWALLAVPYLYFVDRHMAVPADGLWHLGRLVLCQWHDTDLTKAAQYQLGWIVKGFFLPLMFTYLCTELEKMLHYNLHLLTSLKGLYDWAYFALYFIDVALVSMTYLVSLRLSDTHIRSTEPTVLGWVTALICYQPFWSLVGRQYITYEGPLPWDRALQPWPWLAVLWGTAILALVTIYVWATVSFGGRFSNLTHRGIITNGPYRFCKHPAYLAKNLSWWLIALPFVATDGLAPALRRCLLLGLLNLIYYLRAKTEERHLSADPVYVQYCAWMDEHGLLRFVRTLPLLGVLARWRPSAAATQPQAQS